MLQGHIYDVKDICVYACVLQILNDNLFNVFDVLKQSVSEKQFLKVINKKKQNTKQRFILIHNL